MSDSDSAGRAFLGLEVMPSDFVATVRIDGVWKQAIETLLGFDQRDAVIGKLTGVNLSEFPADRLYEIASVATAVAMEECVQGGLVNLYVFSPYTGRFFKLPTDALSSPYHSTSMMAGQVLSSRASKTSEHSWSTGTIWEFDCSASLRLLANLSPRPLLMTTSMEAAALAAGFLRILHAEADVSALPPTVTGPTDVRSWVDSLQSRPRWTYLEAYLYVGLRDLEEMARAVLSSPAAARSITEQVAVFRLRNHQRFVENSPDDALLAALRLGVLKASGVYEGARERAEIENLQWEDLEFRGGPSAVADRACACRIHQVHGATWAGHWTDLLFDRDSLLATFKPTNTELEGLSEEDARTVIRAEMAKNVGLLSQDKGAKAVLAVDPKFGRERARLLTKTLTGNGRRGRPPSSTKGAE